MPTIDLRKFGTRHMCERVVAVANLCGFVCTRTCGFFVAWAVDLCKKWHRGLNVCKISSNANPTYVFSNGDLFYNITAILWSCLIPFILDQVTKGLFLECKFLTHGTIDISDPLLCPVR
jgi:hypothetical protein